MESHNKRVYEQRCADQVPRAAHAVIALPPTYMIVDLLSGDVTYHFCGTNLWADVTNDVYKTTKLVLRRIPAGTFMMGSPSGELGQDETREDYHSVTLTNDYWIGVYEVTQKQWFTLRSTNTSHFQVDGRSARLKASPTKTFAVTSLARRIRQTLRSIGQRAVPLSLTTVSCSLCGARRAAAFFSTCPPTRSGIRLPRRHDRCAQQRRDKHYDDFVCPVLGTLGRYQYNGGWANNGTSVPNADCGPPRMRRRWSVLTCLTHGVSTTCTATSGNGASTGTRVARHDGGDEPPVGPVSAPSASVGRIVVQRCRELSFRRSPFRRPDSCFRSRPVHDRFPRRLSSRGRVTARHRCVHSPVSQMRRK
jgi:hypothetical protein